MTNWKSAERGATEGWNRARTAEARVEELEELLRTAPIDMDMRLGTVAWTKRRDAALAKKGE